MRWEDVPDDQKWTAERVAWVSRPGGPLAGWTPRSLLEEGGGCRAAYEWTWDAFEGMYQPCRNRGRVGLDGFCGIHAYRAAKEPLPLPRRVLKTLTPPEPGSLVRSKRPSVRAGKAPLWQMVSFVSWSDAVELRLARVLRAIRDQLACAA